MNLWRRSGKVVDVPLVIQLKGQKRTVWSTDRSLCNRLGEGLKAPLEECFEGMGNIGTLQ